uniref:Uncharacterized protein n=1 Tax=Romanomermis culicivorax TaxID=13658 RepID=A0A915IYP5_ROMCU
MCFSRPAGTVGHPVQSAIRYTIKISPYFQTRKFLLRHSSNVVIKIAPKALFVLLLVTSLPNVYIVLHEQSIFPQSKNHAPNLFVNKTTMDTNRSTDHYRLSEPTFRHGNFLSRSESADSAAVGSSPQQTKASSLDYRSNNNNQNLTGGGHHQQKGVKKVKCVFLGDARSGKTSLIVSYTTNGYPQNYAPTAFDNFSGEQGPSRTVLVKVDNQPVQLQICDTAGQIQQVFTRVED